MARKKSGKKAMHPSELSMEDLALIAQAKVADEHAHLDDELLKDDKDEDSFYKGKGGRYVMTDEGKIVPVKNKGE